MGRVITDATKMKFDCVKELVRVLKISLRSPKQD